MVPEVGALKKTEAPAAEAGAGLEEVEGEDPAALIGVKEKASFGFGCSMGAVLKEKPPFEASGAGVEESFGAASARGSIRESSELENVSAVVEVAAVAGTGVEVEAGG